MERTADLELVAWHCPASSRMYKPAVEFLSLRCWLCAVVSATFATWLPLQVSIVTVFLFAGPHNWFELRYFLTATSSALWEVAQLLSHRLQRNLSSHPRLPFSPGRFITLASGAVELDQILGAGTRYCSCGWECWSGCVGNKNCAEIGLGPSPSRLVWFLELAHLHNSSVWRLFISIL